MTDQPIVLALELIDRSRTMVLATGASDPWAAPVYYLHHSGRFCFFSSPNSRHVTDAMKTGHCAAAIFHDSDDWRDIEGLQMQGSIELVDTHDAPEIFAAYIRRFPTVRGFFPGELDLGSFQAMFKSRMYAFTPERMFYLNNRAGFGTRRDIE